MILKLYAEKNDMMGMRIQHMFLNEKTNELVARATNNIKEPVKLYFRNKEYYFVSSPKIMDRQKVNIDYPLYSKRTKTIGFNMELDGQVVAQYYDEAATCGKKWIFKRNIGFDVFNVDGEIFLMYRVGFPNQSSHYYCIYDNNRNIVSIIERHSGTTDCRKATIYIENEKYLFVTLMACTEKIVWVADSGDFDDVIDPSAGPYISIMEEEKKMFDKDFIEHVKNIE